MRDIPLGKKTSLPRKYDPSVLYPILRRTRQIEMHGFDLWRSYELSWLNTRGRPQVAILELIYPLESKYIVESKSLKLYLHSLSNSCFETRQEVETTIKQDLDIILTTPWILVHVMDDLQFSSDHWSGGESPGRCIDSIDIDIHGHGTDSSLLSTGQERTREMLYSNLLRTYCPITHQPDWASVIIDYDGPLIKDESLLRYICSYRDHEGFSEECCERIYTDILKECSPERLFVSCWYTRRGGIDINPIRCSHRISPDEIRNYRFIRQ